MNNKLFLSILSVFLLFLTVYTGMLIIEKGRYPGEERSITVSAEGEAFGKPDIATINLSVKTEKETVDEAMEENNKRTNAVIDFLKEETIKEKDIKTVSFNIYPRYDYNKEGGRSFRGYEVFQSLEVKIRDLAKTGSIVEGATKAGANQAGSLVFSIEDEEELKAQAREEAIRKAEEKAEEITSRLGVKIQRILSFSESSGGPLYKEAVGTGDSLQLEPGENRIVTNVSIVFEIR